MSGSKADQEVASLFAKKYKNVCGDLNLDKTSADEALTSFQRIGTNFTLEAKQRASVLWLLSKAYNNEIPGELQDPHYKDNEDQDRLKPQIVQALANGELYCLALANIYADPNYSCLNHHGIMQLLMRKGIYVVEPHDTSLTETILLQTAPIRMSAHMVIIEAIMALYIKEVLIPDKVTEVVTRFMVVESEDDLPLDAEEAALFWINKCCQKFRQRIEENYDEYENCHDELPYLPPVEDLADLSDGCALAALLSLYCPEDISWTEICFNESMSMADSIYNLQLVQFFCQEKLPYNICFMSIEDILYLHQSIRPNILAFIADLLFLFEIKPGPNVRLPGTKDELGYCDAGEEPPNRLYEPDLPTPAEMKAKSLQHSGWAPSQSYATKTRTKKLPQRPKVPSSDQSDDELTWYFSAVDLENVDQSPDVLLNHSGPQSLLPATAYLERKQFEPPVMSKTSSFIGKRNSVVKHQDAASNESVSGQLTDSCSEASVASDSDSLSTTPKTSFAKLCQTKDGSMTEKAKTVSQWYDTKQDSPAIKIAFKQKNEKIDKDNTKTRGSSRDSLSSEGSRHQSSRHQPFELAQQVSSQKTLFQLNDSSLVKQCFAQEVEQPSTTSKSSSAEIVNENCPDNVAQLLNIRLKLEKKRQKIEQERKKMEDELQAKRQDIGKEAFLRVVKSQKESSDEGNSDTLEKEESKPSSEKGFFIAFDNNTASKPKPKPTLRQKPVRPQPVVTESVLETHNSPKNQESVSSLLQNNVQQTLANRHESVARKETSLLTQPAVPGVGFVIGHDFVNPDPMSELEMAKKKEMIMIQSLRRKAEQEAKKLRKEEELARKREEERMKQSEMERKREEDRLRKQAILEQYRQRKCQEEAEKNGVSGSASTVSSKDSARNNNTIVLHRLRNRPNSGGSKPRPKSYHVSASQMQEYTSLDPKGARITDDIDATYSYGSSMLINNQMPNSSSRPQSAMSGKSGARRRWPSPTSRLPSLPSSLLGRHRGPPSDGASDAGSTFSEYTGPKLFVKPTQKSNRGIIINASNVVLAGAVNNETKKRVLEEINSSESKHFLILFRGAGMQFRAIYSYNPDREEVFKLYGTGPKTVHNDMIDKFYKYNSGSKNFNEVQTKHLTVTIDAFTIHNSLWSGKRMMPNKKDSF